MGFILLLRLGQGNRGGLEREPSITKQCHEICMSTHTSKKKIEHGKSYLQTRGGSMTLKLYFGREILLVVILKMTTTDN